MDSTEAPAASTTGGEGRRRAKRSEPDQAATVLSVARTVEMSVELLRLALAGGTLVTELYATSPNASPVIARGADHAVVTLLTLAIASSAIAAAVLCVGPSQPAGTRGKPAALRATAQIFLGLAVAAIVDISGLIAAAASSSEVGFAALLPLAWPLCFLVLASRLVIAFIAFRSYSVFAPAIDETSGATGANVPPTIVISDDGDPLGQREGAASSSSSPMLPSASKSETDCIRSHIRLANMSHAQLHADPTMLQEFTRRVKQAIAKEAGHDLAEEHVHLRLFAGSVVVESMVTPPSGVCHHSVFEKLGSSPSLTETVVDHVHQVSGIHTVVEGQVTVSSVSHSKALRSDHRHLEPCSATDLVEASVKNLEKTLRQELEQQGEEFASGLHDLKDWCARHDAVADEHSAKIGQALDLARAPPVVPVSFVDHPKLGSEHARSGKLASAHQSSFEPTASVEEAAGASMDPGSVQTMAAIVAQKVTSSTIRKSLDGRIRDLQRKVDRLTSDLENAQAVAGGCRGMKLNRDVKSLQHGLVEALVLPPEDRDEAQRLALRLLRQASEVSALLYAGPVACAVRPDVVEELRSKCKSFRELREICNHIVTERVQHILNKTGKAAQRAVNSAVRGDNLDSHTSERFFPETNTVMSSPWSDTTTLHGPEVGTRRRFGDACPSPCRGNSPHGFPATRSPWSDPEMANAMDGGRSVNFDREFNTAPGASSPRSWLVAGTVLSKALNTPSAPTCPFTLPSAPR